MRRAMFFLLIFFNLMIQAEAAKITYDVSSIGGNRWEYFYTVTNDSLSSDIKEFSINFTSDKYKNLSVGLKPSDWDALVIQPDNALASDGYYDALVDTTGIALNSKLGGFSVLFDYVGSGKPGSQSFDVLNPVTFETLESGTTVSNIPLPSSYTMFLLGLSFIVLMLIRPQVTRLRLNFN